ncbi:MAG: hypothetical protein R3A46_04670 [Thermomicrobiales bacterium]
MHLTGAIRIAEALDGWTIRFPVVDIKVSLNDGSYHDVDSSEMAFKIAGSMAIQEAMRRGGPVVLEPVMKVEVTTPGGIHGRRDRSAEREARQD